MPDEVSREDRLLAALCYPFWFLAFLILNISPVLKRQRFVRYHAFQAFFLGMAIWVGLVVLGTAASFIGRFLWPVGFLYFLLSKVLGLGALVLTGWCSFKAWRGEYFGLPYVTEFAKPFIEEAVVPGEDVVELRPHRSALDLVERAPAEEAPGGEPV